jgi:D-sedoheptulose 7-phosphate isomerase
LHALFLFGNRGSAANASHFAQDLNKGTLLDLRQTNRFRAIALTDNVSFLTALANDDGYEGVFVEQLLTLGCPSDVATAISGFGNSPNVLNAIDYVNANRMGTIGVTGGNGGRRRQVAQFSVVVPDDDIGLVEAVHSVLFHAAVSQLRSRLRSKART